MLRTPTLLAVGLTVAAIFLHGCGDARPVARQSSGGGGCTSCHGDATREATAANPRLPAAPPVGTHGESATADRAVGAHQLHLNDGALSPAVACEECHAIPTSAGHSNGTVDMTWGALATTGGITGIVWSGSTCASTYCHGNFRNGNASNAPTWTAPRANPCGTCHGSPSNPAPGGTHPTVAAGDCGNCHDGYTGTTVNLALHLNGAFDVASLSCTSCHGTSGRVSVANADANQAAAPPVDTGGSSSTASPGVGAHLAHANNAGTSRPVLCGACHAGAVPTNPAHSNGTVTVAFGGLATTGGATPGPYTPGSGGSCSASYCHGNFPGGNGTAATPTWITAGALACTACHGSPPPLTATVHHPPNVGCTSCHPMGDPSVHVDGTVQKPSGCTACHGNLSLTGQTLANANTSAPGYDAGSVDSTGQSAATVPGVGAHAAHLRNTNLRSAPIACAECHQLPPTDADVNHATGAGTGGARATLAFGTLARGAVDNWSGASVTPAYAGSTSGAYGATAGTCASSYCHGNFRNGATGNAPSWTAGAAGGACGSCHGTPPGGTHPAGTACGSCHGAGYSLTTVDKALHMNGVLELPSLSCTDCHGTVGRASVANADPNQAAAPPLDTGGSSSTSSPGVGAHLAHVNNAGTYRPVLCAACHAGAVPTNPAHSNGTVTVAFGGLATTGGATPGPYTPGSGGSCTATYCHGNFPGGNGTAATPTWITAGALACTACHGSPPPLSASVHHPRNSGCTTCHPLGAATHVDGTVQKPSGCTACHGNLSLTGQTLANANVSAPGYDPGSVDSTGQSVATAPGVGAHAAHLRNTNLRSAPIACAECHQLPPSDADVNHATGTGTGGARATLAWGTLARGAVNNWSGTPVTPAYAGSTSGAYGATAGTCASSYCHGNFRNGATGNAPSWTAGAAGGACGSCHGTPPGGTHPNNTACGTCHTNYTATTVNLALHMNGVLDVAGGGEPTAGGTSCGGCHGSIVTAMTIASPPAGSTRHFLGGGDNPVDPGGSWSSPLKSSAIYANASCVSMCHGDHPHDIGGATTHEWNAYLDANARSATRTNATRDDTDFDGTQPNGGMCVSCHRFAVDASHPAVTAAAFDTSAHDYVSNTVGTSTYDWRYTLHDGGVFRRNCTKCHADRNDDRPGASTTPFGAVHSSAYASLLAGSTQAGGASPNAEPPAFVCYNCHGSGAAGTDLSGKDLWVATQKAFYHPVNREAAHDSVLEATATWNGGRYSGANRHASCLDCHDPHEAGPTLMNRSATATGTRNQIPAGSPLTGATGVQFTTFPALWTATSAASFSTNPVAATREYEVCFKCHSSFAFGGTPPTAPNLGDSAMQQTDVAMEFNPNNRSMHPVVSPLGSAAGTLAPKSLPATYLLAPWNVNVGTQTMTCTDCHNTDSASPAAQGPHGSAIRFLLAGTNKAWPYTVAGATSGTLFQMSNSGTGFGTSNGLFCRNCHSNPGTGTGNPNTAHGQFNGQHSGNAIGTCVRCHIRIPHGGKVSRLMVTSPNAPARYTVSGQTLNFTRFVKNSTYSGSAWFGTTCSRHSGGGTGGEAW